jgi:membrane protein
VVPDNPPRRLSALRGTLFSVVCCGIMTLILRIILNQTRYNFLYGALGNLVVLLVKVYFFFVFFFFGAQLAFVSDYFDALVFSKTCQTREKILKGRACSFIMRKLFFPVGENLKKYLRHYTAGETIFFQGDNSDGVFYVLEGEVDVLIANRQNSGGSRVSTLGRGSFFGEMGHLLSENRNATVKAKTAVTALALPSRIFDEILKYDNGIDRTIIEHLSRRLKNSNEKMAAQNEGSAE